MSNNPIEIADRIRRQRRVLRRVLWVSLPIALTGIVIVFAAQSRVTESLMNLVIVPTFLGFIASWLSFWGLWILGIRDFRNMFRPGSAEAYGKDR